MKIRNLFLDNNVIIGFLYKLDSLNSQSEDIINSNSNFYYSYHVKQELDKVTARKNDEYDDFFSLLRFKLNKHTYNEFISQSSFHNFIEKLDCINNLNVGNMHYAFDYMWNYFDFGENEQVSEIELKLRKFRYSFGQTHTSRKVNFIKNAICIPSHTHKDPKILDMINDKSLMDDFHGEDEKILFDLHEFSAAHKNLDLILVSWDKTFIEVVELLIGELSFDKYIYLDESNN